GPNGVRQTPYNPWGIVSGQCVISATTPYPEVAFRWCDGQYEREATMNALYGAEGEAWEWAEEGEIGLDGGPAIWRRLSTFGTLQNIHWGQRGPTYRPSYLRLGEVQRFDVAGLEVVLFAETNEKMKPYARAQENVIPPLAYTTDQATELAELRLALGDYVRQMEAEFILGRADLDSGWESYVATLNSLGLPRLVEINQEAYDALFGS